MVPNPYLKRETCRNVRRVKQAVLSPELKLLMAFLINSPKYIHLNFFKLIKRYILAFSFVPLSQQMRSLCSKSCCVELLALKFHFLSLIWIYKLFLQQNSFDFKILTSLTQLLRYILGDYDFVFIKFGQSRHELS